jgi:hypothetical protein
VFVCVCVCVCVCVYIYIYTYTYTHMYASVCIYVFTYVCICMHLCMHVYVGLYVCDRLHIQDAYACLNTDAVIPSLIKFNLVGVCSEAEHMSGKMKRISKFVNLCILISE